MRRVVPVFAALLVLLACASAAQAGPWITPIKTQPSLSVDPLQQAEPNIAMDRTGTAHVVWYTYAGASQVIMYASRTIGGTWSTPVMVSNPLEDSFDPRVAVDASGRVYVVFAHELAGDDIVASRVRATNGTWSAIEDASTAGQDALDVQMSVDTLGNMHAVWKHFDGVNYRIQWAHYPVGGAWEPPVTLSLAGEDSDSHGLVALGNDRLYAVWSRFNGTRYVLHARHYDGAAWGATVNITDGTTGAIGGSVGVDAAGVLHLVWRDFLAGTGHLAHAARMTSAGVVSGAVTLSAAPSTGISEPIIAVNSDGDEVAIWSEQDGNGDYRALARTRRSSAASWTSIKTLSVAGISASYPRAVIDADGRAVVGWTLNNGAVQTAIKPLTGSWTSVTSLVSSAVGSSDLFLAQDRWGNALAMWQQDMGAEDRVRGVWFDGDPPHKTKSPRVTGSPMVGNTLSCSTGRWNGITAVTFKRSWQQRVGGTWRKISGAAGRTYTVRSSNVGRHLRCKVTATDRGGSAVAYSAKTGTVTA